MTGSDFTLAALFYMMGDVNSFLGVRLLPDERFLNSIPILSSPRSRRKDEGFSTRPTTVTSQVSERP